MVLVENHSGVMMMPRKQTRNVPESTKKPADDPVSKRRQLNLDEDLYRKAGVIAAALGWTLPDYVNNRLRPIIEDELPGIVDSLGLGKK